MKKLFVLCFLLLVFIPIYSSANINVNGTFLKDVQHSEPLMARVENAEAKRLLGNIVILPHEPYNYESVTGMIGRLGNIHPSILQALTDRNVKIKLFSGKLTDEPAFAHLKGVKPKGWSPGKTWDDVPGAGGTFIAAAKIGASEKGDGHGSINLELHEIAHSIENKVFQSVRDDSEFQKVWKKEVHQIFPNRDYFINYPEEYFAETFAMYYLNDDTHEKLRKKAPETYQFIKRMEGQRVTKNIEPHL